MGKFSFTFWLFHLLAVIPLFCYSQQPGRVSGTKAWFLTEKSGSDQFVWKDISGNNYNPQFKTISPRNINFHASLFFSDPCSMILSNAQLKQVTFIGVFYPEYDGTISPSVKNQDFYGIRYNDLVYGFNFTQIKRNNNLLFPYHPNFELASPLDNEAMKIAYWYHSQTPSGTIWGEDIERKIEFSFKGHGPEMIIYNRILTPAERQKIETYLAIKYAITLDLNKMSYMGSDNSILLSKTDMMEFQNRICAIGRDNPGGIFQPKSNTSYEEVNSAFTYNSDYSNDTWEHNRSLTIGVNEDILANKILDNQFLFWGDDNKAINSFSSELIDNGKDNKGEIELTQRSWRMFNKNNIGENTSINVSGPVRKNLMTGSEKDAFFILKLHGARHKEDFFPLLPDKLNSYESNDNVIWKNGIDSFKIGRVQKLKFISKIVCGGTTCSANNNEYINKITGGIWPFRKCNKKKIIGYKYRNSESRTLTECRMLPEMLSLAPGELEVYFEGGIGPFSYTIKDANNNICETKENAIDFNKKGIYRINTICRGNVSLVITDFTNQSIILPVVIK